MPRPIGPFLRYRETRDLELEGLDNMDCEKLDLDEVMVAVEEDAYLGFCKACGELAMGCEPDARNYECLSCGESQVFGAEELLIEMG